MKLRGFTLGWLFTSLLFMPLLVLEAFDLEVALLYAYSLIAVTVIVALNRWLKRKFEDRKQGKNTRLLMMTAFIAACIGFPFLLSDRFASETWFIVIEMIAFSVYLVADFISSKEF